jgi:Flp pilus assembly protein CpaB
MARKHINAGTVITLKDITTEIVPKGELPKGNILTPLQVIGRVLGLPVVEGQVLTENCLVPEGTGAILAANIPHGMRAFSVPITSKARPDHILIYPGCVVDVLVEYKLNRSSKGEAVSTAMFRGLRVLAVSGDSVVKNPAEEEKNDKRSSRRGGLLVSLLVDPKQAEALQLAVENGSITMSLRNPLDKLTFALEGSVLNRSTILSSGSMVPSTVLPTTLNGYEFLTGEQWFDPNEQRITPDNPTQDSIFNTPKPVPYPTKSRWQVEIHRGRDKEVVEFDNPEDVSEETETKK